MGRYQLNILDTVMHSGEVYNEIGVDSEKFINLKELLDYLNKHYDINDIEDIKTHSDRVVELTAVYNVTDDHRGLRYLVRTYFITSVGKAYSKEKMFHTTQVRLTKQERLTIDNYLTKGAQ